MIPLSFFSSFFSFFSLSFFLLFCDTCVWTYGFTHGRRVLYHWKCCKCCKPQCAYISVLAGLFVLGDVNWDNVTGQLVWSNWMPRLILHPSCLLFPFYYLLAPGRCLVFVYRMRAEGWNFLNEEIRLWALNTYYWMATMIDIQASPIEMGEKSQQTYLNVFI